MRYHQSPTKDNWPAPGQKLETAVPARAADLTSDVMVPILQAIVTGALVSGIVVLWAIWQEADVNLLALWAGGALVVATGTWIVLLGQTRRLLWAIERVIGLDVDGDGQAGPPAERPIPVYARPPSTAAAGGENTELAAFVRWVSIHGTDTRAWESQFGRDRGNAMRDTLIATGWARRTGTAKNSPWELTAEPAEIISHIRPE